MTLTRADMGVWLISLERASESREAMQTRLHDIGLDWHWLKAVDGKAQMNALASSVNETAFARNTGRAPLPGEIGCYHSHLAVWQQLCDSRYDVALVLEDDIVFHDDFIPALEAGLATSDEWDILRFNAIRAKWPLCKKQFARYRLNSYFGPFTGNGAYLIHKETARRLSAQMLPITRPHDHELNRFFAHDIRLMGLEPWPSHPDDGGNSTITGEGFSAVKKPPWFKRLPYYRQKATNYVRRAMWLIRH